MPSAECTSWHQQHCTRPPTDTTGCTRIYITTSKYLLSEISVTAEVNNNDNNNNNNNNNHHDDIYSVVVTAEPLREFTVNAMNTETAPGGRRPLEQANWLEPQAHLYRQPANRIHHRHYYPCLALYGTPSQSYGIAFAIRDHTVLPATWNKQKCTSTPARYAGTWITNARKMEGWVDLTDWLHAEITYLTQPCFQVVTK